MISVNHDNACPPLGCWNTSSQTSSGAFYVLYLIWCLSDVITPHQIENSWKISKQGDRATSKICSSLILHFCFICILSSPLLVHSSSALSSDGIRCSPLLLFCFSPLPVSSLLHFSYFSVFSICSPILLFCSSVFQVYSLVFSSSLLLFCLTYILSPFILLFSSSAPFLTISSLIFYSSLLHSFLTWILTSLQLFYFSVFLGPCIDFPLLLFLYARMYQRYTCTVVSFPGVSRTLQISSYTGDGLYVAQQIPQAVLWPWALKKFHENIPILTKLLKQRGGSCSRQTAATRTLPAQNCSVHELLSHPTQLFL